MVTDCVCEKRLKTTAVNQGKAGSEMLSFRVRERNNTSQTLKLRKIINTTLQIKTHLYCTLQVPTTQLAKMSIDLKFVELTAEILEFFL